MPATRLGPLAHALARQECQAIAQALCLEGDGHAAVHAARKAVRRLRSLLSLLGRSGLQLERADLRLRRLGQGLSRLRDGHVAVETAATLAGREPGLPWAAVIAQLQRRRDRLLQRALEADPGFGRRHRVVEQVLQDLAAQPWDSMRRADLRTGLRRSQRRVLKAGARARHSGDADALHRWRRKVRRLRMQVEALPQLGIPLERVYRGGRDKPAKALHRLSDQLGWSQDLQLLRNLLRGMREVEAKRALLDQIDAEQARAAGVDWRRGGSAAA